VTGTVESSERGLMQTIIAIVRRSRDKNYVVSVRLVTWFIVRLDVGCRI
jgi:hypothetical protein